MARHGISITAAHHPPAACSAAPRAVAAAVAALLATAPLMAQVDLGTEEQRAAGKVVYDKYCGQCHGDDGDGNGYATLRVKPKPRDFTTGKYKFRTTPNGMLPTDDDLRRAIEVGLPYTSMPGWPNLTSAEIDNVIYYIKSFSPDFENPDRYGEPIDIPRHSSRPRSRFPAAAWSTRNRAARPATARSAAATALRRRPWSTTRVIRSRSPT